ncbi:MAG: Glu-tRNA(Gln) amidotransferase subunit GatE, partial [Fervidicoccaceae archaeon]
IGTIRQDLNVSLRNGAKVEIKGVQELRLLSKVVRNEALRQKKLLEIREELERRGLSVNDLKYEPVDLTEALRLSGSKLVKRLLSGDGVRAFGLRLPKMRGILGVEIQPGKRFGAEVADYVRFWSGAGGLLHRDELPGYGISEEDVRRLCKALGASEEDSFVVVIDEAWRALEGLRAALERLRMAFEGVPRETRMAEPDGTTRYMRPQPGAARMYPETDVPPIVVTEELLREAEKYKPVDPGVKLRELVELYGLSWQLAEQLLLDENLQLAEELMRMFRGRVDPTLVAAMFVNTLRALRREGVPVDSLEVKHYVEALELVASGKIAKEALPMLLEALARSPGRRAEDVASELGLKALSFEELERLVDRVIEENLSLIIERGEASAKLVIGKVMTLARGRADGKIVAELVRSRIARIADSRSRAA